MTGTATTLGSHAVVSAVDRYDDERAAVREVMAGNVDAFESIVRRWEGPLVNLAYRYCRNRAQAEELAQDAFLKIYRGLGSWRQDSRFSTWIYAVASNCYRSALRRQVPDGVEFDRLRHTLPGGDHAAEMDQAARDEAVRRAVAALPARYRDVTILYYFNDMDLKETSRVAGLPAGTVKARLFRARQLLEKKLGSMLGPDGAAEAYS